MLFRLQRFFGLLVAVLALVTGACEKRVRTPQPSVPVSSAVARTFVATAYCTGTTTATGSPVKAGVVAADPRLLTLGSVISVGGLDERHNGTYTVLDTGPKITGRRIDIYIRDCREAVRFGRRDALVTVLKA